MTPTSRREVRYRASGLVLWRIPEMPHSVATAAYGAKADAGKLSKPTFMKFTP
jgi:hypothetical protein